MVGGKECHSVDRRGEDFHQLRGERKGHDRDERRYHLEQHIGDGEALGRRAGTDGRQCGARRRADILADDQCRALLQAHRSGVERRNGDGDGGGRGLHDRGHHQADDDQGHEADQPRAPANPRRTEHRGQVRWMQALGQASHALLEGRQPVKHQREACERAARRSDLAAGQQPRQRAKEDHRQRVGRKRDPHADQRHEPARARRADIGTEHKAESLGKGQKPRADEADRRHRHRAGRLHEQRDDRAPEGTREWRGRGLAESGAQGRSCQRLQAVGHDGHAEQKQPDAAENGNCRRHARRSHSCLRTVRTLSYGPGRSFAIVAHIVSRRYPN